MLWLFLTDRVPKAGTSGGIKYNYFKLENIMFIRKLAVRVFYISF